MAAVEPAARLNVLSSLGFATLACSNRKNGFQEHPLNREKAPPFWRNRYLFALDAASLLAAPFLLFWLHFESLQWPVGYFATVR
ncbi:MAG: hypothetical protein ABIY52_01480, partial [Gemmatimonadaceae bacterium]